MNILVLVVRVLWCCHRKLDRDLTAGVFYIEEIRVVIFTMFSHRKILLNWQTVSVFIINGFVLFLYTESYHIVC